MVAAATAAGADAVHPGYGYLAENPELAEAVEHAGMRWVGPPAAAMRALGRQDRGPAAGRGGRRRGRTRDTPGDDLSDAALEREAHRLGAPLLVKAAAGGGGRGMRAVDDRPTSGRRWSRRRREAAAAFGDDRLYLERRLTGARHVEVQVLADAHGAVHPPVASGTARCSAATRRWSRSRPRRRSSDDLRAALGDAAVAIATAAGYRGAGTVEFLVDPTTASGASSS